MSDATYIVGSVGGLSLAQSNVFYNQGDEFRHILKNENIITRAVHFSQQPTKTEWHLANTWSGNCVVESFMTMPIALDCKALAGKGQLHRGPHQDPDDGGATGGNRHQHQAPTGPNNHRQDNRSGCQQNQDGSRSYNGKVGGRATLSLKNIFSLSQFSIFSAFLMAANISENKYSFSEMATDTQVKNSPAPGLVDPKRSLEECQHLGKLQDTHGNRLFHNCHEQVSHDAAHHIPTGGMPAIRQTGGLQILWPKPSTLSLFSKKKLRHGYFQTFMYITALLSTCTTISNPDKVMAFRTDNPKDIISDILGDMESKRVQMFGQCKDCMKRSKGCSQCRFLNSQVSLQEMKEIQLMTRNLWVQSDPLNPLSSIIKVHYPLDAPIEDLFPPSKSNATGLKKATISLYKKLKKKNLLDEFDEQIRKSIRESHIEILTPEQTAEVLAQPHNFAGINFQLKPSSKSHGVRVVTNSSTWHPNGSLNSHCPRGANLIGPIKSIFTAFRLGQECLLLDLSRAYRTIHTDGPTNDLRLMWWVESIEKAGANPEAAMVVLRLLRLTYGDQPSSTFLELALRTVIAPLCQTELGRKMLLNSRYIDDILTAHHCWEELVAAMDDIESTLARFGFKIKHICSPRLKYHATKDLLNPDKSTADGKFEAEQTTETVFHHDFLYHVDELKLNIQLNLSTKTRGAYDGPSLDDTDLSKVVFNKQSLARLTGQCYKLSGAFIDPLLISTKIFLSKCCKICLLYTSPSP